MLQASGGLREAALAVPFGWLPRAYISSRRIAAVVHIYYEDIAYEILAYMNNLPRGTDVFLSTDTELKASRIARIFEAYKFGKVTTRVVPNRGRDIAPKLVGYRDVYDNYEYVLHLHSKKSVHNNRLGSWRTYLYETLSGSPARVWDILEVFDRAPNVGMIMPQHYEYIRRWISWDGNYEECRRLADRLDYKLFEGHPLDFPSGSMFWARSAALRPLLDLQLALEDFPTESGQEDNTLAHAIERLYAIVCELSGHDWVKIARPELLTDQSGIVTVETPADLTKFLDRNMVRLTSGILRHEVSDAFSTETPLTPALSAITDDHNALLIQAENFSRWTKKQIFPWVPPGRGKARLESFGEPTIS